MQRRAFLAGAVVCGLVSRPASADNDIVHVEGFLVFDRKIQFPPKTYLSIFVTHSWGIQHGNGYVVGEKAEIASSNLPWGFRLPASSHDIFADGEALIVVAQVEDEDGRDFFSGGLRELPHSLIGKRQRIEMSYSR